MAKVTGIGGIFFKSKKDSKALTEWYQNNLGLNIETWGGAVLSWPDDKAEDNGITVWNIAKKDSEWFSPSTAGFMINYRIDNMAEMVAQLNNSGIEVTGPEAHENGSFAWIMDPEGNKIELWEPKNWDDKNKDG